MFPSMHGWRSSKWGWGLGILLGIGWQAGSMRTADAAPAPSTPPDAGSAEPAPSDSLAEATDSDPAVDEATARGREAYQRGMQLSQEQQWGDALAAFEEAASHRDGPLVQFAIAYCLRALGRYVAAREATQRVLANSEGVASDRIDDAKAFLGEFDSLIVHADVTLAPPTARLTVDGRPLVAAKGGKTFLAGVAPPAEGTAPGVGQLTVLLDPGAHLFRAVRRGHQDVVVRKSYRPGDKVKLDLRLDVLPATVAVRSEPAQGIVRLDGREVGMAPAEFQRPAGRYELQVELDGYDPYSASLDLHAGERADLTATLVPYEQPVYETWWFWSTAVAVVAGGVVLTYFLVRPDPTPPPYDGGTTGWVVQPTSIEF